ncbi:MAG: MgtC/SapB family protein, partial [Candidatus Aenigmarchaeota archaeon]|nr:MgtC/SapB family protein [Candidatus Aenigmarchaeota archaeon]
QGAYLFTMSSITFMMDSSRIAAGIVTGIGFIGAGTIIASGKSVKGITTAASLWTTSAIGILVGINEYYLAVVASFMVLVILFLDILTKNLLRISRPKK